MRTSIYSLKDAQHLEGCVLAYGHFNTIHPGHIRYLRNAREQGEHLVVALIGDSPPDQPQLFQFLQGERAEALALLGIVDAIILLQGEQLCDIIRQLNPALLVLGKEFQNSDNEEVNIAIDLQREQKNSVQFHAGDIHYASTDLLSRSERELVEQRRNQFMAACRRQGIGRDELLKSLDAFSLSNIIVLGDTIVDQYAACEAVGMSAEAPVVVVRELQKCNFIGGAGVVASHIRALGASCDLLSVVGTDETADWVRNELRFREIGDGLLVDDSRPSTFKKRYVVENQKLFRVSRFEDHSLDSQVEDKLIEKLEKIAPKAQAIVVSDFVYGVVTERILEAVQHIAHQNGLLLFGDLQCSSQVGAVTKFQNFSLLCPNEREARVALQDRETGLELLSQRLLETTGSNRLIMKLGAEGFIAYDRDSSGKLVSQPFPALSVNPVDVAGAGDSLLAVMATGLATGQAMMPTAALGCCMAALAVETMGNSPITSGALRSSVLDAFNQ